MEEGETAVGRLVNGKMKKHTKNFFTVFTIFLGADSRQIDDPWLTCIMFDSSFSQAGTLNTSPRRYHSEKSGHINLERATYPCVL